MRLATVILGLTVLLCGASGAQATPIFYTVSAMQASGSLGSSTFTNAAVTIDFQSILSPVLNPPDWHIRDATGTVSIGGLGTATFTIPVVAFVSASASPACSTNGCIGGIAEQAGSKLGTIILGTKNGQFKNWSPPLNSDFGPIHGDAIFIPHSFGTSMGGLSFSDVKGSTTFTATTGTTLIPEPGSLILVGTGLFGLICFACRRRS